MTTSNHNALAKAVSFDADTMWVQLVDGRQLGVPLAYFPALTKATKAQRKKCLISGGGAGLHWNELNEDISVAALLSQESLEPTKSKRKVR